MPFAEGFHRKGVLARKAIERARPKREVLRLRMACERAGIEKPEYEVEIDGCWFDVVGWYRGKRMAFDVIPFNEQKSSGMLKIRERKRAVDIPLFEVREMDDTNTMYVMILDFCIKQVKGE